MEKRAKLELHAIGAIGAWYCCSISIIFYNKWLMRYRDFHFPLTVTCVYMAVKLPLGYLATRCLETDVDVSWRTTVRWIIPLALVTSVEIGLSMCAYLFVSVTRITLVKSSAPAWQLLWGLLIGTERASVRLIGVVCLATGGLVLATYARHPSTNPGRTEGILLIVSATCLQGLRGCMVQLTVRPTPGWLQPGSSEPDSAPTAPISRVQPEEVSLLARSASSCHDPCRLGAGSRAADGAREREHIDPVALVYLLAPWTTLFSLLIMLALEGGKLRDALTAEGDPGAVRKETLFMILGAGAFVFCLVLIELKIVQLTSALTLSVAGALKECIAIIGGHLILHDRMSSYNAAGLVCTLLGVHLYRLNRTGDGGGVH